MLYYTFETFNCGMFEHQKGDVVKVEVNAYDECIALKMVKNLINREKYKLIKIKDISE